MPDHYCRACRWWTGDPEAFAHVSARCLYWEIQRRAEDTCSEWEPPVEDAPLFAAAEREHDA